MSQPVLDLDNIVTLVRVYFLGDDVTAEQKVLIKNRICKSIQLYDAEYNVTFDLAACTAEVLEQIKTPLPQH